MTREFSMNKLYDNYMGNSWELYVYIFNTNGHK